MTDLFDRVINFSYGDPERSEIVRKVWTVTPHMIECYTDRIGSDREISIREWLLENLGHPASPIYNRDGVWQFGGAVVYGWSFLGFATKELLDQFLEAFPDACEEPVT